MFVFVSLCLQRSPRSGSIFLESVFELPFFVKLIDVALMDPSSVLGFIERAEMLKAMLKEEENNEITRSWKTRQQETDDRLASLLPPILKRLRPERDRRRETGRYTCRHPKSSQPSIERA